MATPTRIQRRRCRGWRMPDGAVYVGRPTRWGNPVRIDRPTTLWIEPDGGKTQINRVLTPAEAVIQYLRWHGWDGDGWTWFAAKARLELAGKDLACWCPTGRPCHAEALLLIANHPTDEPLREWLAGLEEVSR